MPIASSGSYRDPARPGVLLVPCPGAVGLGFGTVVIYDTETAAAADSTAAALHVTCVRHDHPRPRAGPVPGRQGGPLPRHCGLHG